MNYPDRKTAIEDLEKAEQFVVARQYQTSLLIIIKVLIFLVRRVKV